MMRLFFSSIIAWVAAVGSVSRDFGMPGLAATEAERAITRLPKIDPDYCDLTIPANIAPLNFRIEEQGIRYKVTIRSASGSPIELEGKKPQIMIPIQSWKDLVSRNQGKHIYLDIAVKTTDGGWNRYQTITNKVAVEPIDGHLVYRVLRPLYNVFYSVGIYQRDLGSFKETEVLSNERFNRGCLNCHTFLNHSPDNMLFHTRAVKGNPMIYVRTNMPAQIAHTAGYMSWHPSGRLIAYSANKLSLFFHTKGETRDVYDAESNLGIYRMDSNIIVNPSAISDQDRLETWPSWSPDGRFLYYCATSKRPLEQFYQIRYDLMRVSYDIEKDVWGVPELLVDSSSVRLSAAQPRVSPDGKWMVFSLAKHGNFPIFQPTCDLYMMDTTTREYRKLEINSDQTDSWHCWSSNGRWMVFSSKRRDNHFTRPFFTHVDPSGKFSKPFILPQENPDFYDSFIKNYNVPELIVKPITISPSVLAKTIMNPTAIIKPDKSATPSQKEPESVDEGVQSRSEYEKPNQKR